MRLVNRMGQRFGRLVVVGRGENNRGNHPMWMCQCDCGGTSVIDGSSLGTGRTTSCGCKHRELTIKRRTTHGMYKTKEYNTWRNMKSRCSRKTGKHWKDYGSRGITVCPEWVSSFETFYRDMGDKPEGMSLDRIDNDGNYLPGNCRWATDIEQRSNRRCSV